MRTAFFLLAAALLVTGPASPADVTLYWTAVGNDILSGTASAYEMIYSTDSAAVAASNSGVAGFTLVDGVASYPDSLIPFPSPSGTPESLTVTGLNENEIYFFGIKARDDSLFALGYNIARGSTVVPDTIPPASRMELRASP